MFVSIITPVFNSENYLEETINSVLNQTYQNWELIIIDDCSTDNSVDIINKFLKNDSRIKFISLNKNSGVASARNSGIEVAKGRFIAFLDSDDIWDENKLEYQLSLMIKNDYALTYTAYRKINNENNVIAKHIPVKETGLRYKDLLKHNEIGFLSAIYDSDKIGKQNFLNQGHEDYSFWLNILKKGFTAWGINKVLASYRVHSNGISSNKLKAITFTWNIYRNVEKLSLFDSIYYFIMYSINSSLKRMKK